VTNLIAPSLQKKGLLKSLAQIFEKKPFGSLDEVRIQGSLQNPGVRMQIPTTDRVVIDSYLLMPRVRQGEQDDSLSLRASLIAQFLEKHEVLERPLSSTSEEALRKLTARGACELEGSTVALYCLPNAGLYELGIAYESETVDLYRNSGVFCLFWNYRGYGHSQGSASMQSMVEDGSQLVKLVRHGFKAGSLILHGRSLGGHVVKALADQADLLVVDRSFTSISMIPRDMFGKKWIQVVYELFIDNYEVNVDRLLAHNGPKVLIADTKVARTSSGRNHQLPQLAGHRHPGRAAGALPGQEAAHAARRGRGPPALAAPAAGQPPAVQRALPEQVLRLGGQLAGLRLQPAAPAPGHEALRHAGGHVPPLRPVLPPHAPAARPARPRAPADRRNDPFARSLAAGKLHGHLR
jgi:hypothetical protein